MKYINIKSNILSATDLNSSEKLLYGLLVSLCEIKDIETFYIYYIFVKNIIHFNKDQKKRIHKVILYFIYSTFLLLCK